MTHFKFGREFLQGALQWASQGASLLIVTLVFGAMTFISCVDVNDTLGADLIPEEQDMRFATALFNSLSDGVEYFQTRLYKSDSINMANQEYLYMGAMHNDTFGLRRSGFFVQHTPGNTLEDNIFGYHPLVDSVTLFLTMATYSGDSTYVQSYEVYEVVDDTFITESADTNFFHMLDIESYTSSAPLFTFDFPDQANGVYTSTSQIRLTPTTEGDAYVRRLLFVDADGEYDIDIDYDEDGVIDTADVREAYNYNDLWVSRFKGLYIKPVEPAAGWSSLSSQGAIYASDILYSGFGVYGRSLEESDPTIIADSLGMTYMFYPIYEADEDDNDDGVYYVGGEVSINKVVHDYSNAIFDFDTQVVTQSTTDKESIPTVGTIYVEGMGGVVSQITIDEALYLKLDTLLEAEYASSGDEFESIFFNQAMLKLYLIKESGVEEDYTKINPVTFTSWLNKSPSKLALYSQYSQFADEDGYSTLIGVSDYSYYYESLGASLDFSGELNRSWGCYTFNIPSHLQLSWNSFLDAKQEAGGVVEDINWDDVSYRTFYLAHTYSSLFSVRNVALQSMTWDDNGVRIEQNNIPMSMSVTYTMID